MNLSKPLAIIAIASSFLGGLAMSAEPELVALGGTVIGLSGTLVLKAFGGSGDDQTDTWGELNDLWRFAP